MSDILERIDEKLNEGIIDTLKVAAKTFKTEFKKSGLDLSSKNFMAKVMKNKEIGELLKKGYSIAQHGVGMDGSEIYVMRKHNDSKYVHIPV